MKILFASTWVLLGLFLLGACQSSAQQPPASPNLPAEPTLPPLPELDADEVALGETVYQQNCATCHGANLEGQPDWKIQGEDGSFKAPPHDETGHTWHHADDLLLEAIQLGGARFDDVNVGGTSNMPAFAEILNDEESTAVLTYIKSRWPDELRQSQWQVTVMTAQQQQ